MEDFRTGQAASRRYRNRRIGEFPKELDLAEARSTGVPKIFRAMRQNGSPEPIFESNDDRTWFLVRLLVHERAGDAATEHETDQDAERSTEQDNFMIDKNKDPIAPQVTGQVTGQVEQLLAALAEEMSRADLQTAMKLRPPGPLHQCLHATCPQGRTDRDDAAGQTDQQKPALQTHGGR